MEHDTLFRRDLLEAIMTSTEADLADQVCICGRPLATHRPASDCYMRARGWTLAEIADDAEAAGDEA